MEKPNIEKEVETTAVEPELTYQFFTKEGALLLGLAVILIATGNTYARYFAWPLLLLAFMVPIIKKEFSYIKKRKH
jgi:hypothetical protein